MELSFSKQRRRTGEGGLMLDKNWDRSRGLDQMIFGVPEQREGELAVQMQADWARIR